MISRPTSVTVCFLVGTMFSRFSLLSGTDPKGVSVALLPVYVVALVRGMMEAKGVGTVNAAAVLEESCKSEVLFSRSSAGVVELITELFMLSSVGLDLYNMGE